MTPFPNKLTFQGLGVRTLIYLFRGHNLTYNGDLGAECAYRPVKPTMKCRLQHAPETDREATAWVLFSSQHPENT